MTEVVREGKDLHMHPPILVEAFCSHILDSRDFKKKCHPTV